MWFHDNDEGSAETKPSIARPLRFVCPAPRATMEERMRQIASEAHLYAYPMLYNYKALVQ